MKLKINPLLALGALLIFPACERVQNIGKVPELTTPIGGDEYYALISPDLPQAIERRRPVDQASLWSKNRDSLLGDRRASARGDILTVLIEIDDSAEFSNTSSRSRSGSDSVGITDLFGIPQRIDQALPEGASLDSAISTSGTASSTGNGSISRGERLTLSVAATIVDVLQNGVLSIQGTQEVRVNNEIRELVITGYVRPEDVSRQNQITYEKIASARVSYGGRGQITDVQQPRYGQQIVDIISPF